MYPDENDAKLPVSLNRIKPIPLQLSSAAEAEAVGKAGGSTLATSAVTCVAELVANLALQASLNQLWGMLNS